MGLKKIIINRKINSRLNSSERNVCIKNFETASTAGIIWDENDEIAYNKMKKKFDEKKIKYQAICLSNNKYKKCQGIFITSKDFNFFGMPKNKSLQNFLNSDFDLLIDISLSSSIYVQIIRSFSMAHLKIGWAPVNPDYFDITIDIRKKPDSHYLIEQIDHYLNIIN